MKQVRTSVFAAVLLAFLAAPTLAFAEEPVVKPYVNYELGAIRVLAHTYRSGSATVAPINSTFDFVAQGGQEILYPFERFTAGLAIAEKHDVQFLYQPLQLDTQVTFKSAVTVDDVTFATGTPMNLTYGFPFYRLTYRYRVAGDNETNFSAGGAIQLRNASIRFAQQDGAKQVVSQNLGIVPALAIAGRVKLGQRAWLGMEATGIYASSSLINGATFAFEGSIIDASLRAGMALNERADAFINARFFGGTAAGISQYPVSYWTESADKDTENRIAAVSLTLGANLRLAP